MKSIFDSSTREELIQRIESLDEHSTAAWGKMNVYQMLKHGRLWEEMILGILPCKRVFIGRLFGKLALRLSLKEGAVIGQNAPTSPELVVRERDGDIQAEKKKWIARMQEHDTTSSYEFIHPFFGKMTREQIGQFAYKHTDHHLRQFKA